VTAKTLLQVRTAVRDRAHVSAKDPRFNDDVVNRSIQQAYGEILTFMPGGWWWNRFEINYGATNGEIPLLLGNGTYIEGVEYVYASTDGDYWQPIRRRTRTDSIRAAGGQTAKVDIPDSWGVEWRGNASGSQPNQLVVVVDPPSSDDTTYRIGVSIVPPDLQNDTDQFEWLPVQFTGAIIERASARLIRVRREVGNLTTRRRFITAATLADTAFDGWMKALRLLLGKPYGGPGYTKQHWRS
jgi:hypothetical protein